MKRFMISSVSSGGGKTVMTSTLIAAFIKKGIATQGFKVGPDYIDPMYHKRLTGIPSRNLDIFLQGRQGVLKTLEKQNSELLIIEGVMGFYDGMAGTDAASAWDVADLSDTPVILTLAPKGAGLTLAAQLKGMKDFREKSHIAGIIFTKTKRSMHDYLKPIIERETGIPVLGFLPEVTSSHLESRHLGLVMAEEVENFREMFSELADLALENIDLDRILELAAEVPCTKASAAAQDSDSPEGDLKEDGPVIAVAMDEAFNFYYEDNFDELREAGAKLVFFSPLHDDKVPPAHGIYLGGGYPENHCEEFSKNASMLDSLRAAVNEGVPIVAECGGFLSLQKTLEAADGRVFAMADILPGEGFRTSGLRRFGYMHIHADRDSLLFREGDELPVHEFHHWDSTDNGTDLTAVKPGGKTWKFGFATDTMYAAFPHLHFGGEVPLAERFVGACRKYMENVKES